MAGGESISSNLFQKGIVGDEGGGGEDSNFR